MGILPLTRRRGHSVRALRIEPRMGGAFFVVGSASAGVVFWTGVSAGFGGAGCEQVSWSAVELMSRRLLCVWE